MVHLLLGALASFREGWKDKPVPVGRKCRERLLVFGVTPYWDQLRESLFLMSDLEPVRGAPAPKDPVQCLHRPSVVS